MRLIPSLRRLAAGLFAVAALAAPAAAQGTLLISYGPDFGATDDDRWRYGFVTGEVRPDGAFWRGVKPIYSFGVSGEGAVYLSAGIRGDIPVGGFLVTPHFSVAAYQDGRGGFDSKELLQFRTGIDAFWPLSHNVWLGIGYYHISNASITDKSADADVVRVNLMWRY